MPKLDLGFGSQYRNQFLVNTRLCPVCTSFTNDSHDFADVFQLTLCFKCGMKKGFSFALKIVLLIIKSPSITVCLQIFRPSTGSASKVSAVPLLYYCTLLCSPALCIMPALVLNMK